MTDIAVLKEFVTHSNWIEGYAPDDYPETSTLFARHLQTAQYVDDTRDFDPQRLHTMLLSGTSMLPVTEIGIFRSVQVWVGRFTPPTPGRDLLAHVEQWKVNVVEGPGSEDPEQWCWDRHHEFECCHPFTDGNGRTGRLILNALRLTYGLPWLTVHQGAEQQAYYRTIDAYQHSGRWSCSNWKPKTYPVSQSEQRHLKRAEERRRLEALVIEHLDRSKP